VDHITFGIFNLSAFPAILQNGIRQYDMIALHDPHHAMLSQSLVYLFELRLGIELYRPKGREWYDRGFYWHPIEAEAIANLTPSSDNECCPQAPDQFAWQKTSATGYFDQDNLLSRWLPFDRLKEVDYLICTSDRNEQRFADLKRNFKLNARIIRYIGNREEDCNIDNFDIGLFATLKYYEHFRNLKPCMLFHPEFSTELYSFSPPPIEPKFLRSFLNFQHHHREAGSPWERWQQYAGYANEAGAYSIMHGLGTPPPGVEVELDVILDTCFDRMGRPDLKDRSKWPDLRFNQGEPQSHKQIAELMKLSNLVLHIKRGSEGYGYVIHNLAAMGRPPIIEYDAYRHLSARAFLQHKETCLYVTGHDPTDFENLRWALEPENNLKMSKALYDRFTNEVNFPAEAAKLKALL
jgi:hypothetical protein